MLLLFEDFPFSKEQVLIYLYPLKLSSPFEYYQRYFLTQNS